MSRSKLGSKNWKAKKVICIETNEVFEAVRDVERKYKYLSGNISACCRGEQKTSYDLHWVYI